MSIKNVAIIGAAGALGKHVLDAIAESGKFNVTALIRSTSKTNFPSSVKTAIVDYNSVESLTAALRGQDAVVSTVGNAGLEGQTLTVDAAIAAGVKRFIPSEFGSDLDNPRTREFPVFGRKVAVQNHINEKVKANPDFSYTILRNGAFLDWGLEVNFLLDLKSGKPRIFDGGDRLFSATTLKSVGQGVVGILEHPDETKNRAVYIQDIQTTQNKILAIAKKVAPQKSWEPVPTDTETIKKASFDAVKKGDFSIPVLVDHIYVSLFGDGYGGLIKKTDNDLLGVAGDKTDADIEVILKSLLTGGK